MGSKNISYNTQSILYVFVILGLIAVGNYLLYKKFVRIDLTENKIYSISPASKNLMKKLDDIININVYFSKNLPPHLKKVESDVKDLLTEFKAYSGKNLQISWQDPSESEEVKKKVEGLGIPEIQMQSFEKDKAQVINGFLGLAVLYADKKEVLPVIQNINNFEYDLAQAIMKVFRKEAPKVAVMKTDTMPYFDPMMRYQMQGKLPEDQTEAKFKPIFESLKENYEVTTLDISDGKKIDPSFRSLIIPGGDDVSFTDRDLFEIDQYFMNGGNLIVLADAVRIDMEYGVNARVQHPRILDLLQHYGVKVENGLILDASCGQVQIPQQVGPFQMNVPVNYPYIARITPQGIDKTNPAVSGLNQLIFPWANPLSIITDTSAAAKKDTSKLMVVTTLISSSDKSFVETGNFNLNPQQDWNTIFNTKQSEFKPHAIAVHLRGNFTSYYADKSIPAVKKGGPADTSKLNEIKLADADKDRTITPSNKNRNLIVIGDSDFLTPQSASPGNTALLQNIVDWVSLDDNLISVRSRNLEDRTIKSNKFEEGKNANTIRMINILAMPILLIIVGLFIFMRRREAVAAGSSSPTTLSKEGN
ncbi:MAG: GldG family protein [Chitinivibrionales bacterium]|nr:GldG family protein [Chitinivibrionales bacterium]